jgi:2-keto-4-pentenoate hydratase/2-oxohepta-3-ene-1,7-dioic acid hydratase in catechol pathway
VKTALGTQRRLGVVLPEGIIDLNSATVWHLAMDGEAEPRRIADTLVPPSMLEFLQGGATSATFALAAIDRAAGALKGGSLPPGPNGETLLFGRHSVRVIAPLPRPESMRDFYAFEDHVKKGFEKRGEPMPQEWYDMPVYYKGNHQSIVGPDEDVAWPSFTERFDYELELAVIIGRKGKDIPEERAADHIAGFTVMNDFSARDIQRREMKVRLGPAKGKDFATAIGPYLVTPDEIKDPYNLRMTAKINGELWSEGNSRTIHYSFEKMIAFASMGETLYPGDLIGSGTVGGGCGLELDRWVKPGDTIELEIEKIGVLKNRIVRS